MVITQVGSLKLKVPRNWEDTFRMKVLGHY